MPLEGEGEDHMSKERKREGVNAPIRHEISSIVLHPSETTHDSGAMTHYYCFLIIMLRFAHYSRQ